MGEGDETTHFCDLVFIREEDSENGATTEQVLDFESVDVGIVSGFIVVEHEVDGVGLEAEEEELEDGVVEGAVVPEYVCVEGILAFGVVCLMGLKGETDQDSGLSILSCIRLAI